MAFFASSNVTVTITPRKRFVADKLRVTKATIAFGDGSLAYCSGGVPLPAVGAFGFHRQIDLMSIQQAALHADGSRYLCRYDADNHKIMLLQPYATASGGALGYYAPIQIASGSTPIVSIDVMVFGE